MAIPTAKQSKEIKKEIVKIFGSIAEFKSQLKDQYTKYIDWLKLPPRKQGRSWIKRSIQMNGSDYAYFANVSNGIEGINGKGFYVCVKTNVGNTIQYKIY